jgi:magnesium-transporting ATPase (P-type)
MMVMKGADNVIKQRLKKGSKWLKVVEERVQEFSERGLRTLLFCYKQISE